MTIGPVQLVALGFDHPNFTGEIKAELERLRQDGTVRVIDALAIYKDADGEMEVEHLSNLSKEEAIEMGTTIGALLGLGIDGEEGMEVGAAMGADAGSTGDLDLLSEEDAWDVVEDIPNDSAAALLLLEHHWAAPLRDAVMRAGGYRIGDTFVSPLDLVEVGLMSSIEAEEVLKAEAAAAAH